MYAAFNVTMCYIPNVLHFYAGPKFGSRFIIHIFLNLAFFMWRKLFLNLKDFEVVICFSETKLYKHFV